MQYRDPANLKDRIKMAGLAMLKARPTKCNLKAPLVSFSFDDAPKTSVSVGAKMLEDAGAVATFYLTGSHCGQSFEGIEQYSQDDIQTLANNGHEIACHSFSHSRFRGASESEMAEDLAQNQRFFANALNNPNFSFDSFAYPYGEFDAKSREYIGERYLNARGVYRGVNHGVLDFANLKTTPLEKRRFSSNYLQKHLKTAQNKNGWVVFFTHDIADDCSIYGSTPDIIAQTIEAVRALDIEIVTVREGAKRILARA